MSTAMPELADFELDGLLRFERHDSGLLQGIVTTEMCKGRFFLHGAHVVDFQPAGEEPVLFLSSEAVYRDGKAIRGGVPICFPWFNAKKLPSGELDQDSPAHGLVRQQSWQILSSSKEEGGLQVILGLDCEPYRLEYKLIFGNKLHVSLAIHNVSEQTQEPEVALHTYFQVADLGLLTVEGDVVGLPFLDQLTGETHPATNAPIAFTEETDRIYHGAAPRIEVCDRAAKRKVILESSGSCSTVVWNPWVTKAARMADFGGEEYQQMCCVETANIGKERMRIASGDRAEIAFELGTETV